MALFYGSIGLGIMIADLGIQLVNNGISISRSIYNFSYNIVYGKPKSKEEILIDELTQQIKQLYEKENEHLKQIEELSLQLENHKIHRIRNNNIIY